MKVKKVLVIGLGRFGDSLIETLWQARAEVIAVDASAEQVEQAKNKTSAAFVGDGTDPRVLSAIGAENVDTAVVTFGEDFEATLAFYRDVLGMPVQEAYEAEGDARVVILDAGRATLELSNAAQVRFIDRVEAEGRPSAPIRVALEVDDTDASTAAAVEGGAALVAEVRETPWRSRNSRLEGPAGLQLTLFQELGTEG